jgi:hypothetical protein
MKIERSREKILSEEVLTKRGDVGSKTI